MVGSGYADGFERSRRRLARRESRGSGSSRHTCHCGRASTSAVQRRCQHPTKRKYDSGGAKRAPKVDVRERELGLVGASGGNGEMNATHAGAHLSAELEELEANGLD